MPTRTISSMASVWFATRLASTRVSPIEIASNCTAARVSSAVRQPKVRPSNIVHPSDDASGKRHEGNVSANLLLPNGARALFACSR